MEETICIASHFADDCVSHMLFKCEEMLFSSGFLPSKSIRNQDFMLHECFYENMIKVKYFSCCPYRVQVLAQSGFIFFFGVFPYFFLLLFLLLPFLLLYLFLNFRGSTRPGADDETYIFESNRNIFLFSSAHDIHSVLRFESVAMFKAEPRLSG